MKDENNKIEARKWEIANFLSTKQSLSTSIPRSYLCVPNTYMTPNFSLCNNVHISWMEYNIYLLEMNCK